MPRTLESKIVSRESLPKLAASLHDSGVTIVTTNGCFDLLHWGHIHYLDQARRLGDVLICGVNSDRSVKALNKGLERPIVDEKTRLRQLAGLESIDFVTLFDEDSPEAFLKILRPHIHVKGGDYKGRVLPEKAAIDQWSGRIFFVDLVEGFSTTKFIDKIKNS